MLLTVASEYKISAYVSNENGYDDEAIELGYVIDPAFKGRGFATEAVNAVINELHEMGFKKVVAGFFERNISAMSVKWSSKELANPRALSVIYDREPITSS